MLSLICDLKSEVWIFVSWIFNPQSMLVSWHVSRAMEEAIDAPIFKKDLLEPIPEYDCKSCYNNVLYIKVSKINLNHEGIRIMIDQL